ncbi:MAG: hypothetical protein ACRDJO_10485 [Actinomycetota bacterium]
MAVSMTSLEAGERLAAALAEALGPVLPRGIDVGVEGDTVWVSDGVRRSGTPLAGILAPAVDVLPNGLPGIMPGDASPALTPTETLDDMEGDTGAALVMAVTSAVSRVQDFVSEAIRSPWPGADASPRPTLPELDVVREHGLMFVRFVRGDVTCLALPPVPVGDLLPPTG